MVFGLATTFGGPSPESTAGRPQHEELQLKLALVKETFARFPDELCRQLLYRGWWLAGCSIATFHPDLVAELPRWRPLAGGE
jgi:NTE family protein